MEYAAKRKPQTCTSIQLGLAARRVQYGYHGRMSSVLPRALNPIEESPEYFWEQYSPYAATFQVSPEPMGSPLLEVLTPLGPIFVFDRGLVPHTAANMQLILHGQAERWEEGQQTSPLNHLGGGRYELAGQVTEAMARGFFVLEVAQSPDASEKLKILLYAEQAPQAGQWVIVQVAPPLMAFRPETQR